MNNSTPFIHPDGVGAPTTAISLIEFADSFAAKTNSLDMPDVSYAADQLIWDWLWDMRDAAESNRPDLVAKYARMVTDMVAAERANQE